MDDEQHDRDTGGDQGGQKVVLVVETGLFDLRVHGVAPGLPEEALRGLLAGVDVNLRSDETVGGGVVGVVCAEIEDDVGFLLRPVAAAVAADRGAEVVPDHADRHLLGVDADADQLGADRAHGLDGHRVVGFLQGLLQQLRLPLRPLQVPSFLDHGLVVGDLAPEGQLLGVELRHQRVEDVVQEVLQGCGWHRLVVAHLPVLRQHLGQRRGRLHVPPDGVPLGAQVPQGLVFVVAEPELMGFQLGGPAPDLLLDGLRVLPEFPGPLGQFRGEQFAALRAEGVAGTGLQDDRELPGQRRRVERGHVVAQPAHRTGHASLAAQHQGEEQAGLVAVAGEGLPDRLLGDVPAVVGPGRQGRQGRGQPVAGGLGHQLLGDAGGHGVGDVANVEALQQANGGLADHGVVPELPVQPRLEVHDLHLRLLHRGGAGGLLDELPEFLAEAGQLRAGQLEVVADGAQMGLDAVYLVSEVVDDLASDIVDLLGQGSQVE